MTTKNWKCLVGLSALTLTLFLTRETQANVVSFNLRSTGGTAMPLGEEAGAPGVFHDNWNDVLATASGGTALTAGTIRDETGAFVGGLAFTVTSPSFSGQWPGSGSNTAKMFSGAFDINNNVGSDLHFTLTGIPYVDYDVYVYGRGGSSTTRGGEVWLNGYTTGTRKSMRHLSTASNTGYVLVNDTDPFDSATGQGSYLVFSGQNGSSLTLDVDALGGDRFPIAGIQIMGELAPPISEPSALVLAGIGLLGLLACGLRKHCRRA